MRIIFLVFFSLLLFWAKAQPDLLTIETVDSIRTDYIHTVQFRDQQNELAMPIVNLGSRKLYCSFDDSYGEYIDYFYTVKHCDKNWNFTEDIEVGDYLDGQERVQIENFGSSIGTQFNYTHYSFVFPNEDMSMRWSGNYLLIIYDDEGTVVITRRFYVIDEKVSFQIYEDRPNGIGTYDTHQAFKVELLVSNLNPENPVEDIYVTAFQNRMNERTSRMIQPILATGDKLEFNPLDQIAFPGYKEYNVFDTRNILQAGDNVRHIDLSNTHSYVLLELEQKRRRKPYYFREEVNGANVYRNFDKPIIDRNMGSEYPSTLFTLESQFPEYGEVYVVGEFSDWKELPAFRMEYLELQKAYNLEVPLKQGFYNYYYALKSTETGALSILDMEGSSYETENEYHFLCYYRPRGQEYDQLVGHVIYHQNLR